MDSSIDFNNAANCNVYSKNDSFIVNQIKLGLVNEPFYFAGLFLVCIINYKTNDNILLSCFTLLVVELWSYIIHILVHKKLFPIIDDLHILHHTPCYSDSIVVLIAEALQNFFVAGGFILIFFGKLVESYLNIRIFNYYIILAWALFYLTFHLVNYHIFLPESHKQHHIDNGQSNYGPEWLDVLFDTKTNNTVFENQNSGVVNLIFITIFILYFRGTKYDLTHLFDGVIAKYT